MNEEKRKGRKAVPEHIKSLLNEDQLAALPQLERFGWEIGFVRMPVFQPLVIGLYCETGDQYGILTEKGIIDTKPGMKARR